MNFQLNNKNYKNNEIIANNKRDLVIENSINIKYAKIAENKKEKNENLTDLTSNKLNKIKGNEGETKEENKNIIIDRKITRNINNRFEETVHTNNPISGDDINIIEIKKDVIVFTGLFLIFYQEVKNFI